AEEKPDCRIASPLHVMRCAARFRTRFFVPRRLLGRFKSRALCLVPSFEICIQKKQAANFLPLWTDCFAGGAINAIQGVVMHLRKILLFASFAILLFLSCSTSSASSSTGYDRRRNSHHIMLSLKHFAPIRPGSVHLPRRRHLPASDFAVAGAHGPLAA